MKMESTKQQQRDVKMIFITALSIAFCLLSAVTLLNNLQIREIKEEFKRYKESSTILKREKREASVILSEASKEEFKQYVIEEVTNYLAKIPLTNFCQLFKECNATDFGLYGLKGSPGEKGEQGFSGEKGGRGFDGEKGEQGHSGEKGDRGFDGAKGERGIPGERGIDGKTGPPGIQGMKGNQGLKGEPGEQGIDGIDGPSGIKGDTGLKGERGPKGDKGDTGIGIYSPILKKGMLDIVANISDKKILSCKFFGNPIPKVSWNHQITNAKEKEQVDKKNLEITSYLEIHDLQLNHTGPVTCSASNILGVRNETGMVQIHTEPILMCPNRLLFTFIGADYEFPTCIIESNPPASISWKRGFGAMPPSRFTQDNNTLLIKDIQHRDEGFYILTASNYIGQSSITFQLKTKPITFVRKPPTVVKLSTFSKNPKLTCSAEGNLEKLRGKWIHILKPNQSLASATVISENKLTLTLHVERPGGYQCQFTDGTQRIETTTFVQSPPFNEKTNILSAKQARSLLKILSRISASNPTKCFSYRETFNSKLYDTCISRGSSIIIVEDTGSDIFGIYNDINNDRSFSFDCRNRDECHKLSSSVKTVCFEPHPTSDSNRRECQYEDLVISTTSSNSLMHLFRPLWPGETYKIRKMEIFNTY